MKANLTIYSLLRRKQILVLHQIWMFIVTFYELYSHWYAYQWVYKLYNATVCHIYTTHLKVKPSFILLILDKIFKDMSFWTYSCKYISATVSRMLLRTRYRSEWNWHILKHFSSSATVKYCWLVVHNLW